MKAASAKAVNLEFYDKAYSGRFFVNVLIKRFFSYDQLSKTRRNLGLAKKVPEFSKCLSVFDYGFGYGTLLLGMPKRHKISGCELSAEAISNVRAMCSLLRREVSLYSPEELAVAVASNSLSLDLICCSHVIEHVDDDAALINLFGVMLKENGHLLLNVPINEVWVDPKHARQYSSESLRELLGKTGFQVVEMLEADRWSAWILHHEYVSEVKHRFLLRAVRLLLGVMPNRITEYLERFVPETYRKQQLLVLAKKI